MPQDARAVANRLIELGRQNGEYFTNLKVIKLVYFCHAWMLGIYGKPLIKQEVEAWTYGPVIPDVYHSFKRYGPKPILASTRVRPGNFSSEEKAIIRGTYKKYGGLTALRLSQITHAEGTPWSQVSRGDTIPNKLIQSYYADQVAAASDSPHDGHG